MITGINESETLTKYISCWCKCKFDGTKCNSNQWWNNGKCRCDCKKHHLCEKKQHVWSPSKCIFENRKYLASIMDDSTIICDEVTNSYEEEIKTIRTNFNEKIVTFKTQFFIALLAFLLIAILLMIAANIYCCMIKYQTKHLLPFHSINN